MRKTAEPKVGIAKKTKKIRQDIFVPEDVHEALKRASLQESLNYGRRISPNEFVVRAIIDRVGKVFGIKFATRLYRQYFNGIAPLKSDHSKLPEITVLDIGDLN